MEKIKDKSSTYTTTDGILVDDNDNESIIIYRPIGTYMSLEDVKLVDKKELPKLSTQDIILKKNEFCCFIGNGITYKTKTITTGYINNRKGGSIRITKGISYHTGTGQSQAIRENQTTKYEGILYLTNQRLIYISPNDDSFDKPISKLTSVLEAEDGVIIQIGSKTYSIQLDTHVLFMLIFNLIKYKEYGTELPEIFNNKHVQYTVDPNVLRKIKNNKKENKKGLTGLQAVVVTILIILIIGWLTNIGSSDKIKNNKVNYDSNMVAQFTNIGFSKEQAQNVSSILKDMQIREVISLKPIYDDNNNDISKEQYNELYECYCDDGDDGAHIYLYFKDKKLIYSCFSNHWVQFYDVNRGVIDYPGSYSN